MASMTSIFCGLWSKDLKLRVGIVGASLLIIIPLHASAHQSPGSCNANRLNLSVTKDRTVVYQGQTLTYTVTVSNDNFGTDSACDITGANVQITLPAADGTPTGQTVILETNQNYAAGTGVTLIGTIPYVVNVNAGVVDIVAEAKAEGVLHDAPVDHAALIIKTVGTSVVSIPGAGGDNEELVTPPAGNVSGATGNIRAINAPKLPNTGTAQKQ